LEWLLHFHRSDRLFRPTQIQIGTRERNEIKEKEMTNQESEHRRIVVETPTARREEIHSEAVQYPERRGGVSSAALAAIVIGVVALAAIIVLFVLNQQQTAVNDNMTAQQQQPPQTIVQQPAPQQPPIIVQQPAPATQPAPVIINGQPAPPAGSTTQVAPMIRRFKPQSTRSSATIPSCQRSE
jgi:hypothetical protein